MEFFDVIKQRRSTRRYLSKPVEREKILRCIEAARLAPSACNVQPWKFVVVDDADMKSKLIESAFSGVHSFNRFTSNAGAIIVVVAEKDLFTNKLFASLQGTQFYMLDIGAAAEHLILEAEEMGLGTCWLGWFSERSVKKLLGIPRVKKVAAMISIGYHDKHSASANNKINRKQIEEIYSFNRY